MRWPLQPLQPLQKHNSSHLSVHQWIRSAICDSQQPTSLIAFLFLKLPPPPCAALLAYGILHIIYSILYITYLILYTLSIFKYILQILYIIYSSLYINIYIYTLYFALYYIYIVYYICRTLNIYIIVLSYICMYWHRKFRGNWTLAQTCSLQFQGLLPLEWTRAWHRTLDETGKDDMGLHVMLEWVIRLAIPHWELHNTWIYFMGETNPDSPSRNPGFWTKVRIIVFPVHPSAACEFLAISILCCKTYSHT